MKWFVLVALGLVLTVAAVACANDTPTPVVIEKEVIREVEVIKEVAPAPGPRTGGTLRVLFNEPPSLDNMKTCNTVSMTLGWHIWDNLLTIDSKNELKPGMADSWALSPDGLSLELTLRDGLQHHDGKPVTTDDVVASVGRWMELDRIGKLLGEREKSITAVDSKTVSFKLNEPLGPLLYGLAKPGCRSATIWPEWVVDKYPSTSQLEASDAVGSGVFKFGEWVPTSHLTLERFDGYKPRSEEPDGWSGGRIAYVDEIRLVFIPQVAAALAALKAGQLDWAQVAAYDEVAKLQEDPDRFKIYLSKPGALADIMVNMHPDNLLGKNPKGDLLRRAIWLAQDSKSMMSSLGPSQFWSLHHNIFFENTVWSSDAGKDIWEYHDIEEAKKLVAEAGYNGEQIRCSYTVGNASQQGWCLTISDLLTSKLGMNAIAEPAERAQHLPIRLAPDRAELLATGFNSLTSGYPLNNLGIDQGFYHWQDDNMLQLTRDFASANTYEEQKVVADKMQLLAFQEMPMYTWGERYITYISREWVNGYLNTQVLPVWWNIWLSR